MSQSIQIALPLQIQVAKVVDGLEMGVLNDGTPYLSQRALARLCGVANSSISDAAADWAKPKRTTKLGQWLEQSGLRRDRLFIETEIPGVAGNKVQAFPEDVCMRILEYYAFETANTNETATKNYRTISRAGLRLFVYAAVGYDPNNWLPTPWKQFHERLQLHVLPRGYFSVFREMTDLIVAAIQGGMAIDNHTVPDISVGQTWAKHWTDNNLDATRGARRKHEHNYPDSFPQAASNPQEIWVYPLPALPEFRAWLFDVYVPTRFPRYLDSKVKQGVLPATTRDLLLEAVTPPELGAPSAPVLPP